MDKFIKTATGGLPLRLDDLMWEKGELDAANYGVYEAIRAHLLNYGTDYIVEGCTYSAPNITAGWIMLAGELLRIDAHAGTDNYFAKVTTYDSRGDKVFKDTSAVQTYQKNRGVLNASSGSLNITTALRLADVIVQKIAANSTQQFAAANIPNLDAAKITTGVFGAARIPDLDAAKITTGTLDAARIPDLDAAKITTGTLDAARIPNLDAAKITTGTLDAARIPNLDAAKITTGTLDAARIPNLDASKIATGTLDAARLPLATEGAIGAAEIGTLSEVLAAISDTKIVTPLKLIGAVATLRKIINIGDWDMDATGSVTVAHGLTFSKIINFEAVIINDAATLKSKLGTSSSTGTDVSGYVSMQATDAFLVRFTGGLFDSTNYDSTSYNRGFIIIDYLP